MNLKNFLDLNRENQNNIFNLIQKKVLEIIKSYSYKSDDYKSELNEDVFKITLFNNAKINIYKLKESKDRVDFLFEFSELDDDQFFEKHYITCIYNHSSYEKSKIAYVYSNGGGFEKNDTKTYDYSLSIVLKKVFFN